MARAALLFLALLLWAAPAAAHPNHPSGGNGEHIWVAHRGASRLEDENTLAAFKLAAKHGIGYVEMDPRLTKDGVFILMHDVTVDRTTDGTGRVEDLTFEAIRQLKTKNGHQVPTFDEALATAKEAGINVYIDVKVNGLDAMEQLMAQVRAAGMADRVIVNLWWTKELKWMQKNHPDVVTAITYPAPVSSMVTARKMGATWIGTLKRYATPALLEKAHKQGLKVITMPINDLDEMRAFHAAGLDGLQTDDPRITEALQKELAGQAVE